MVASHDARHVPPPYRRTAVVCMTLTLNVCPAPLSGDKMYLAKCVDLARHLRPAFDTKTGIPYNTINLAGRCRFTPGWFQLRIFTWVICCRLGTVPFLESTRRPKLNN